MKKIKELNLTIYEVRDLNEEAMEKAICDFTDESAMLTGEDFYTSTKEDMEDILDAIESNEYYYDVFGTQLPIYSRIEENDDIKYSLSLTDYLSVDITIE